MLTDTAEIRDKIDHYLNQAEKLRHIDQPATIQRSQTAAELAEQIGDVHRYGLALQHLAWCYGVLNQNELSLAYATEGLKLAREFNMLDIEAHMVGAIGHCYCRAGIPKDAEHLFAYQYSLGERLEDPTIMATALIDQSTPRSMLNDFQGALLVLEKVLEVTASENTLMISRIHTAAMINLALMYDALEQYDKATEYAEAALPHANDLPTFAADGHLVMASYYFRKGDLEMAQVHLDQSRAHAASTTPPNVNFNTEMFRFKMLQAEGDHEGALRILEIAYERSIQNEQLHYAIRILENLKAAHEQSGNNEGLLKVYKRLMEDMPAHQQQMQNMRMTVLQMVFDRKHAVLESRLVLSKQINTVLTRLSHEFRTPLAIIRSTSELIDLYQDKLSLEQRQQRLQKINAQVDWITTMLDDILQLLVLEQDSALLLTIEEFTLNELLLASLSRIDRYKEVSSSRVRSRIVSGAEQVLCGPLGAFKIIIVHLLTNAVKFSRDDVMVELETKVGFLNISVTDSGIGIPAADQRQVFNPLVRGSNLDEVSGNGMGLALVQKLIQQMNGVISIDSIDGAGTTVRVRLPLASAGCRGSQ